MGTARGDGGTGTRAMAQQQSVRHQACADCEIALQKDVAAKDAQVRALQTRLQHAQGEHVDGLTLAELTALSARLHTATQRVSGLLSERQATKDKERLRQMVEAEVAKSNECSICCERKLDTVLNCGHRLCFVCAANKNVHKCLTRRATITSRTKYF